MNKFLFSVFIVLFLFICFFTVLKFMVFSSDLVNYNYNNAIKYLLLYGLLESGLIFLGILCIYFKRK
jgi:hypothetical protein